MISKTYQLYGGFVIGVMVTNTCLKCDFKYIRYDNEPDTVICTEMLVSTKSAGVWCTVVSDIW